MEIDSKNTERSNNDQSRKDRDKERDRKSRSSESSKSSEQIYKSESRNELTDDSKRDRKEKKRSRSRSRSRDRKSKKDSITDSRDRERERDRDRDREKEASKERRDRSRDRSNRKSSKERSRDNEREKDKYSSRSSRDSKPKHREEKVRKEKEEEEYVRRVEEQLEEEEVDTVKILEEKRRQREAILSKFKQSEQPSPITAQPVSVPIPEKVPEKLDSDLMPAPRVWDATDPKVEPPLEAEPTSEFLAADYDDRETKKEEHISKPILKLEVSWAKTADDDSSDEEQSGKKESKIDQEEAEIDDSEPFLLKADGNSDASKDVLPIETVEQIEKKTAVDDIFAPPEEDDMFAQFDANKKFVKKKLTNIEVVAPGGIDTFDDEEGYYKLRIGEMLGGRYRITSYLGRGVFAAVMKAVDTKLNIEVAIKMIRNNETMYKAGQKELQILKKLNEADPLDKKHIVRVKDSFEHRKHLCIVFESLNMNLREVIRKYGKEVGLNIQAVKHYGIHLFMSLEHLQSSHVIHADLKPDNILVNGNLTQVKLADLGSASSTSENEITPYLVSRFYRAPEIILGLPYDCAIDIWAAGCTLYELYTGKILYPGASNNQMIKYFMQVKGKFPNKMIRKGQFSAQHFDENYNFISVEKDKVTNRDVTKKLTFNQPTRELTTLLKDRSNMSEEDKIYLRRFIDLLDKCFQLNPEQRITAKEALKHPFFAKYKPDTKK